jgi:hypothetical protein
MEDDMGKTQTEATEERETERGGGQSDDMQIFRLGVPGMAARWYIFKPKIPICVNFGGSCSGKIWHTLWPYGMYYGHLVSFTYCHWVIL